MRGNIFFVSSRYVFLILSLTQFLVHGQRSEAMASMLATAQLKKQMQCQMASERLIDDVMHYANAHELATPVLQQLQESLANQKKITDFKSFYNGLREFSVVVARMHKLPKESCYELFEQETKKAIGNFSEQFKLAIEQQGSGVDAVPTQLKTLESLMNQAVTNAITLAMPTKRDVDLNGNDEDMLGGTRAPSDSAFIAGTGAAGTGLTIDKLGLIYGTTLGMNSDAANTGATTVGNATAGGIVTIDSSVVIGTDTGIKIGNSAISSAVERTIAIGTSGLSGAVVAKQNIDIGNGTMAGDGVNLKTITVDIGSGAISGAAAHVNTITVGNAAVSGDTAAKPITVNIASGIKTATFASPTTVNIGSSDSSGEAHQETVNIGAGTINNSGVDKIVNIITGTDTLGDRSLNIATGTNTAGIRTIIVGTTANTNTTTNIHGLTQINQDTTDVGATTIGNVTNGGVVTVDSATGANKINIGYTAGANPDINVGTAAIASAVTQNIAVGTSGFSGTAAETVNIDIGNGTIAGSVAAKTLTVDIASGIKTATFASPTTVNIGSSDSSGEAHQETVNIGAGTINHAGVDKIVNIITGTDTLGDRSLNIATGTNTAGTRTIIVGTTANTNTTTSIHGTTNINQDATDVGVTTIGNTTVGVVNVATLSTSASTYKQANGTYAAPSNTFSGGTTTGSYYYPDTTRKLATVFEVGTGTFNVSQGPSVAFMNNATFAIIYTAIGAPVATSFQRYNADYTTLGAAVQVDTGNLADGTGAAAIAYDTSRDYIIVAWVKANGEVYVSSYKASDGTVVGAALLVSSTYAAAVAAYPSLAIEGDGTIGVFWQRNSDKKIYANNVSTAWAAGATPVAISAAAAETAGNQCAAYLGGTTAVVCWKEVAVTKYLHYNTYDITANTAGTEGHVQETALDDTDKHGAVAAIRFGNVMFTYKIAGDSLHRKVFDNTLTTVLVTDGQLVGSVTGDQFAVAADGISFMVAYSIAANYLKVANYDATGTIIGTVQDVLAIPAASINDASRPALALCGGDCVASWYRYDVATPAAVDAQAFSLKGYGVSTIGGRNVRTSTIGAADAIKNTTDIYGTLNVTGGDIATSGNVYVNGSVNMAAAELSGNLCVNGNIVATGSITGQGTCPSDKYIKTNVHTLDQQKSFDAVKRLRPISYTYTPEFVKRAHVTNNNRQLGLIAQEVEELVPEVVSSLSIGGQEIRGISYDRLVPSLICAIQLLQKKVEYLEAKH